MLQTAEVVDEVVHFHSVIPNSLFVGIKKSQINAPSIIINASVSNHQTECFSVQNIKIMFYCCILVLMINCFFCPTYRVAFTRLTCLCSKSSRDLHNLGFRNLNLCYIAHQEGPTQTSNFHLPARKKIVQARCSCGSK